jgi:hypothetical protein
MNQKGSFRGRPIDVEQVFHSEIIGWSSEDISDGSQEERLNRHESVMLIHSQVSGTDRLMTKPMQMKRARPDGPCLPNAK